MRLQGSTWTVFDAADGVIPGTFAPGALAVAPDGVVWVGALPLTIDAQLVGGGVAIFDNGAWSSDLERRASGPVTVASDGTVWVATSGVSRLRP